MSWPPSPRATSLSALCAKPASGAAALHTSFFPSPANAHRTHYPPKCSPFLPGMRIARTGLASAPLIFSGRATRV